MASCNRHNKQATAAAHGMVAWLLYCAAILTGRTATRCRPLNLPNAGVCLLCQEGRVWLGTGLPNRRATGIHPPDRVRLYQVLQVSGVALTSAGFQSCWSKL